MLNTTWKSLCNTKSLEHLQIKSGTQKKNFIQPFWILFALPFGKFIKKKLKLGDPNCDLYRALNNL